MQGTTRRSATSTLPRSQPAEGWAGRRRAATADALSSRQPWVALDDVPKEAEPLVAKPEAIIGPRLRAVSLSGQRAETAVGVAVLNRMLNAGRPTPSAACTELLEVAWVRGSFARVDIHATTPFTNGEVRSRINHGWTGDPAGKFGLSGISQTRADCIALRAMATALPCGRGRNPRSGRRETCC
jgi:hypothetical protein